VKAPNAPTTAELFALHDAVVHLLTMTRYGSGRERIRLARANRKILGELEHRKGTDQDNDQAEGQSQ
jgi:hypothetical protein